MAKRTYSYIEGEVKSMPTEDIRLLSHMYNLSYDYDGLVVESRIDTIKRLLRGSNRGDLCAHLNLRLARSAYTFMQMQRGKVKEKERGEAKELARIKREERQAEKDLTLRFVDVFSEYIDSIRKGEKPNNWCYL